MFLSIRHKPHFKQVLNTEVINKDTGERIPRVIWANDTTGRYRQNLVDEQGNLIIINSHAGEIQSWRRLKNGKLKPNIPDNTKILSKIFTGNIELRTKE